MGFISRGFRGKRRDVASSSRVPPGQYVVTDFPVLSAGPTPRVNLDKWTFTIEGEIDEPKRWTWKELIALPSETVTKDIHCVTKWSKLDTIWKGVSVDKLMDGVDTAAEFTTIFSDGGYTTNLPLDDITGNKAWVVYEFDGQPLPPEHGGPVRFLVPADHAAGGVRPGPGGEAAAGADDGDRVLAVVVGGADPVAAG